MSLSVINPNSINLKLSFPAGGFVDIPISKTPSRMRCMMPTGDVDLTLWPEIMQVTQTIAPRATYNFPVWKGAIGVIGNICYWLTLTQYPVDHCLADGR